MRVKLGSPVIFKQPRPGKDEKVFTLYKFRSMTDERDENGDFLPDEIRLTKFGRTLRSTSLDELPELFNIFKGDLALVGPRPQLVRDMVFMTKEQRRRHSVRPGLTGLAQISGRNSISWDQKLLLDQEYLENISFREDFRIVIGTAAKVLHEKA
ncbi:MAG: sugar transferase [Coriobacteriales bacterium]